MGFSLDSYRIFEKDWALLTAGSEEKFNTMTIGWGGLGTLWSRTVATVYVKPIRYTYEFLEKNELFTVSFFPEAYRKALVTLGTLSGRDGDKVAQAGLTPKALDKAVTFEEAKVTLLCRKIYRQQLDTAAMPADIVAAHYEKEAAHVMYIGEVVDILS